MNNFTLTVLTVYDEYLAGTLIKRPERVRCATTTSIFFTNFTGLVDSDLSFVELGTGFELDFLDSETRSLTSVLEVWADCVFSRFGRFPLDFRCARFLLRSFSSTSTT